MSISPFDHLYLSGLIGDGETAKWFTIEADIAAMLAFESALARAEADENIIEKTAADAIGEACDVFLPDIAALRSAVAIDGVVVPELVRQLRGTIPAEHRAWLHFGTTSQDVIDSSLMLRLRPLLQQLRAGLTDILAHLDHLAN